MGFFEKIFGKKSKDSSFDTALQGSWISEDKRWSASVSGKTFILCRDDEQLYSGPYYHDYKDGDLKAKVHLGFDTRRFKTCEGTELRIRRFYSEGDKIYIHLYNRDERRLAYSNQINVIVLNRN